MKKQHFRSLKKKAWQPSRIDVIAQNGNTGDHYDEMMGDESFVTCIPTDIYNEVLQTTQDQHVINLLLPFSRIDMDV